MRKIKSIEEAIEIFKIAAVDNHIFGDYKKANKAYDDLKKIEKYLFDHQRLDVLKTLYDDDNLWVRLSSAVSMASYDTEKAYKIIETIRDMNLDPYSFYAKYAIINWANLSNPNRDLTSK